MSGFLQTSYVTAKAGILAYPGGTAAVLVIVCAVVARFGLDVTVNELTAIAAVAAAMAGAFVHRTTVSKVKPPKKPRPGAGPSPGTPGR